jgi:uncharacterized phage protein (TIGR01671 family)
MKEIKFRAWDTLQGGKFEYWDSKINQYDGIFWTMIKHKSFKEPNQFTGLKDKNGKEIYEGDILQRVLYFAEKEVGRDNVTVIFDYCSFCFLWKDKTITTIKYLMDGFQIIGNIYENPELLK